MMNIAKISTGNSAGINFGRYDPPISRVQEIKARSSESESEKELMRKFRSKSESPYFSMKSSYPNPKVVKPDPNCGTTVDIWC